jgi:glycosyltransferase involved in cell wall biosynthesis
MIDVILPVLDEEEALPFVLGRMPAGFRPLVVDNGSSDASAALAAAAGARVVSESRRGFGAACYAGLIAATSDVVCFMDADASLDPADLPLVAAPVVQGRAHLVLGARRIEPGAMPLTARIANRVLAAKLRRRGIAVRDLGPMRAARRTDLLDLAIEDRASGWPLEMVLRAAAAGWTIEGVEVPYRPRLGRSKVTGTVGGTLRAARDMTHWLRTLR